MDGILNNKLRGWFQKAFTQLQIDGITQDIHVDELLAEDYKTLSRAEILYNSYKVFDCLVQHIKKTGIDTFEYGIMLSIDLESESSVFQGIPQTVAEFETILDMYSVPEIILYYDANPGEVPLTEIYRAPILLNLFVKADNIKAFYKEYRVIEDQISNGDYIREINVLYIHNVV